ncbi:hypothetical protein [Microcoleus vaginatus]|uniref:hypothetical protein n=1 Tax=Microcoleus vaginatus TaxID=119532 RepID=UPI0032ACBAC4
MYIPESQPTQTKVLPTMYALPSEDPEYPGLPDEYHSGNHKSCAIADFSLII